MNGQPIQRGQPSLVITTDASLQGFWTSIDGLSEARVLPEFCSLSDHTAIIEELRFSCQNVIMYSGLTVVDSELSPYMYLFFIGTATSSQMYRLKLGNVVGMTQKGGATIMTSAREDDQSDDEDEGTLALFITESKVVECIR